MSILYYGITLVQKNIHRFAIFTSKKYTNSLIYQILPIFMGLGMINKKNESIIFFAFEDI